jgi:hypothetical protein
MFKGEKELSFFVEWLWFFGAMCFEFEWPIKDSKEFEVGELKVTSMDDEI